MTKIKNSTTFKPLIIFKILVLLLNIKYVYGAYWKTVSVETKIQSCFDELKEVFGEIPTAGEYFRHAIMDTSKKDLIEKKSYLALKYFEYFFTKIKSDTSLWRPLIFCEYFTTKIEECENECKESNFILETLSSVNIYRFEHNVAAFEELVIYFMNLTRAEKLELVKNAYFNIGPNEYKGKVFLEGYMTYISKNSDNINISLVEKILEFCHGEMENKEHV